MLRDLISSERPDVVVIEDPEFLAGTDAPAASAVLLARIARETPVTVIAELASARARIGAPGACPPPRSLIARSALALTSELSDDYRTVLVTVAKARLSPRHAHKRLRFELAAGSAVL